MMLISLSWLGGHMGKGFLEPEVQVPQVHRNTPFEYAQTAQATQRLMAGSKPIPLARAMVAKAGTVATQPRLPSWMTPLQGGGSERTSR